MNQEKYILCAVYKSSKDDESYIYVDQSDGMSRVPETLLAHFPNPTLVTQFKLTSDRKLARADASKVLQEITDKGFYVQMPPPKDAHLQALSSRNELLPR